MRHLKTALVAVAAAVLAATATVALAGPDRAGDEATAVHLEPTTTTTEDATAGGAEVAPGDDLLLTADEAADAALTQVPGEAVRTVRDDDDGRPTYEVHVRSDEGEIFEIHVDATDGRVVEVDREDDLEVGEPVEATVTREDAEAAALEAAGADEVLRSGLEDDDGRPEWEVDVRRPDGTLVEVTIDGTDGRTLEIDVED